MGTGYTTLHPSRRKFPPLMNSNDNEESSELDTDVGEGSPSPASSHATGRGIAGDRRATSAGRNS